MFRHRSHFFSLSFSLLSLILSDSPKDAEPRAFRNLPPLPLERSLYSRMNLGLAIQHLLHAFLSHLGKESDDKLEIFDYKLSIGRLAGSEWLLKWPQTDRSPATIHSKLSVSAFHQVWRSYCSSPAFARHVSSLARSLHPPGLFARQVSHSSDTPSPVIHR